MKKKRLIVILFMVVVILFYQSIHTINKSRKSFISKLDKEFVESKKSLETAKNDISDDFDESLEIPSKEELERKRKYQPIGIVEPEPIIEKTQKETQSDTQEHISNSYTTRMTSFWSNDGYGTNECTGSGKCSWDFGVNEKGWYTYQGKLVVATATTYLAKQGWKVNTGVHLYKYYEELVLTIDGVEYDAIILDSCGSSMKTDRIDLFVSNGSSARDTMINVRRK